MTKIKAKIDISPKFECVQFSELFFFLSVNCRKAWVFTENYCAKYCCVESEAKCKNRYRLQSKLAELSSL